jgi:putative sterol carrier protein
VARFLTPAWFDEINAADVLVESPADLVIEQHITGGPAGNVRYQVTSTSGRLHAERLSEPMSGKGRPSDVLLRMDYETAVALATGALTAHDAFLAGRVRVSGDPVRIQQAAGTMPVVTGALTAVREHTTY